MTKKTSSAPVEILTTDILSEDSSVAENLVDITASEDATVMDEAPVAKKKAISRKKKTAPEDSAKAKVKKVAKRSRSTKIDSGDSSPSAPVMKAFWGVFNPMMVQVAQYNYADEAEAHKAAADMTEKKKAPHFVQLIKKVI